MNERRLVSSPSAAQRLVQAREFLRERASASPLLVLGSTSEAAADVVRSVALAAVQTAVLGWYRMTLGRVAATLAQVRLAEAGLAPVGTLALEAVVTRVVARMRCEGALGRFAPIAELPGLPRALARTIEELRVAQVTPTQLGDRDLGRALGLYEEELDAARLADRALVMAYATAAIEAEHTVPAPIVGVPLLVLDAPVRAGVEQVLLAALVRRAPRSLATVPLGDEATRVALEQALGVTAETLPMAVSTSALQRLQAGLFAAGQSVGAAAEEVRVLSAPGESRECVEIARLVLREAARGVRFDDMAVLLRAPAQYRTHLEEALRRAGVPAYFAHGVLRPDPAGRAFLALLACAAEGLSARRFAEYLSLGEVPDAAIDGTPPAALPSTERWVPPDTELVSEALQRLSEPRAAVDASWPCIDQIDGLQVPVVAGNLRAPRHWERLLVDAAVIGGRARWERRLAGLRAELELALGAQDELDRLDEAQEKRTRRTLLELDSLERYALPLLDALAALPAGEAASWGVWREQLSELATRALRRPERVLAVLAELSPMDDVGPVDLAEVRLLLAARLAEVVELPTQRRQGRVYVAPIERARGLSFDVVFVPGLAEKLFPQRVSEDPILRDAERAALHVALSTNAERAAGERLALRIAVGAARTRVVLSYPRLDLQQARPRTPSFYGLEVLRAAEGVLPSFQELAARTERESTARMGWPAPARPDDAIDEAEHDLALLGSLLGLPDRETIGTARYLLSANEHLARALRARARRWIRRWTTADGLVEPSAAARVALFRHALEQRSYSPTALQHYAACPYRFLLSAVHRLAPREDPLPLEELDPLTRGSLMHEVLFELHERLRDDGLLPLDEECYETARALLEQTILPQVAARYREALYPAIERVWEDGIASVRADLLEWLRQAVSEREWRPAHFELSFGLKHERRARDPMSRGDAVQLGCGIQLRGSIDLVEVGPGGKLRATDYKTGKVKAQKGAVIGGGEVLQPVMYALALEQLLPGPEVVAGRLYYCTATGDFTTREVPLDDAARGAAKHVADVVGQALREGFLPAAPNRGACQYCDFLSVCGPHEELRASKVKPQDRLTPLLALRKEP